ncbi:MULTISPECIES: phage baseplate assembly protein V [Comamonas]|uniref:phage baseplate assembly protein V n=1 Tax=Comamonas TaxID=283 RepID=UPI00257D8DD4|nr:MULTISPECIES: phage baseplate assembly protein V [Comamonas]
MPAQAPELSPVELYRLLANMIRTGRVEQVRTGSAADPARCRVRTGELLTTWLPWVSPAAGGSGQTRHWRTPAIGEPCLLLAPGGDLAQAVALSGLFSDDMPQGAVSEDVERHDFSESDFWEHNRPASTLRFEIAAAIELKVGASVLHITPEGTRLTTPNYTVDSPDTEFTGAVTVQKLLTFNGGIAGQAGEGGSNAIQGGIAIEGGSLTHNGKHVGSAHTHANNGAGVPN